MGCLVRHSSVLLVVIFCVEARARTKKAHYLKSITFDNLTISNQIFY